MFLLIQRRRSSALELENEIKIRSMLKLKKKKKFREFFFYSTLQHLSSTRGWISRHVQLSQSLDVCLITRAFTAPRKMTRNAVQTTVWDSQSGDTVLCTILSSGMWPRVTGREIPIISKDCAAMIFKSRDVQEETLKKEALRHFEIREPLIHKHGVISQDWSSATQLGKPQILIRILSPMN